MQEIEEKSITTQSVRYLINSASWMKFSAVFIMILTGLYALIYGYNTVKSLNLYWRMQREFEEFGGTPAGLGMAFWIAILLQVLAVTVSFYLCSRLLKSANSFSDFIGNRDKNKLESAFGTLRTYWTAMGIFVIICFILLIAAVALVYLALGSMGGTMR